MLIQGKNEEMGGGLQDSRFEAVQRRLSKEKEAWLEEDVPGLRSKHKVWSRLDGRQLED